jgi:hypothetical protein
MLTSKEYRQQAKECLELAARPEESYVRPVLLELAAEFNCAADELEIKEQPQADSRRDQALPAWRLRAAGSFLSYLSKAKA